MFTKTHTHMCVSVCVCVVVAVVAVVVVVVVIVVIVIFNNNVTSEVACKNAVCLCLSRCWNTNYSLHFYKSTGKM